MLVVGAAVSAVPVLILPYNLPLARKGMLRKQSIPLYFMETRILVAPKVAVAES
jgi:hypothetical protein